MSDLAADVVTPGSLVTETAPDDLAAFDLPRSVLYVLRRSTVLLRQSAAEYLPLFLVNAQGQPATGVTAASDLVGSQAIMTKGDATTATISLTDSVNWVEVNSTSRPGHYQITATGANLGVLGPTEWQVVPAASAKFAGISGWGQGTVIVDTSTLATTAQETANTATVTAAITAATATLAGDITTAAGAVTVAAYATHKDPLYLLTSDDTQFAGGNIATILSDVAALYALRPATTIAAQADVTAAVSTLSADITSATSGLATGSAVASVASSLSAVASSVSALPSASGNASALLGTALAGMTSFGTIGYAIRWAGAFAYGNQTLSIAGNTLTLYAEDDTTTRSFTLTPSTTPYMAVGRTHT